MGQHLPDFAEPRWFVCHTKPRSEKKFAALLERERFPHYLALIRSVRRYGTQTKTFTKPLFPGYVFARLEPQRKNQIYQQDLLVRALPVENEAVFLRQLEDVKTVCASGLEAALHPLVRKGTHVRVLGGPLHGLEGYVDDPVNPRGIIVAVDVLQQGLLVRLPLENLQLLP
ncbi:MAG TPA: transcription termination/antitermination NusG family protein [Candidatus Limnocylindria bacterium]|jgi:transcription antitermination factor NusG|nr:transcription termination/antitermination NusG family protein [Candidatus Limnocylindria bacterium]HTL66260.1 transcription termination/antitermination NusG family protein [Lacunisphaera sp.]